MMNYNLQLLSIFYLHYSEITVRIISLRYDINYIKSFDINKQFGP